MFSDKNRQIRFHSCLLGPAAGPALRRCEHLLDTDQHVPGHSALWSHKAFQTQARVTSSRSHRPPPVSRNLCAEK